MAEGFGVMDVWKTLFRVLNRQHCASGHDLQGVRTADPDSDREKCTDSPEEGVIVKE